MAVFSELPENALVEVISKDEGGFFTFHIR